MLVGALQLVGVASSVVAALVLAFGGLLFRHIIAESIAAEELNTILAMEQYVASDRGLGDAIRRIEALAHRLVEWRTLRITRTDGTRHVVVYATDEGLLQPPMPTEPEGATLRVLALGSTRAGDRR